MISLIVLASLIISIYITISETKPSWDSYRQTYVEGKSFKEAAMIGFSFPIIIIVGMVLFLIIGGAVMLAVIFSIGWILTNLP